MGRHRGPGAAGRSLPGGCAADRGAFVRDLGDPGGGRRLFVVDGMGGDRLRLAGRAGRSGGSRRDRGTGPVGAGGAEGGRVAKGGVGRVDRRGARHVPPEFSFAVDREHHRGDRRVLCRGDDHGVVRAAARRAWSPRGIFCGAGVRPGPCGQGVACSGDDGDRSAAGLALCTRAADVREGCVSGWANPGYRRGSRGAWLGKGSFACTEPRAAW